ncbi:MAG: diguanylate cyclase (GGDEF)-like protein [Oceanicoccus sp.]|jgi:diguanylate cyclase (GGDEF)-like protein
MPTTVQQSNTFALRQIPKDKSRALGIDKEEHTSLRLQLISCLQTTLELEQILKLFFEEVQNRIPLGSLEYSNSRIQKNISFGSSAKNSCEYKLDNQQEPLGTITFTRARRFSEAELELIETLLRCLICPIRNALMYRDAIKTSLVDPLTGAGNRLALENTLEREVGLALRHTQPLSVAVVDIDNFKVINDTYGHAAGDAVLANVAKQLSLCSRETDSAYRAFRYGGEEFVSVLNNTNTKGSLVVGERIRSSIESLKTLYNDQVLQVTVSVGVSSLLNDDNMSRLFQRADKALYKSKHMGRNRVVSAGALKLEPTDLVIN